MEHSLHFGKGSAPRKTGCCLPHWAIRRSAADPVIICSLNPRSDYLRRADSFRGFDTLPANKWELLPSTTATIHRTRGSVGIRITGMFARQNPGSQPPACGTKRRSFLPCLSTTDNLLTDIQAAALRSAAPAPLRAFGAESAEPNSSRATRRGSRSRCLDCELRPGHLTNNPKGQPVHSVGI